MKRILVFVILLATGAAALSAQSINMKVGWFSPSQSSDLWQTNHDNLTFKKSDMNDALYLGEYEIYFDRLASIGFETGYYERGRHAQYRDYETGDGKPIYQSLQLRLVPVMANLRFYPLSYRRLFCPYIGVGAGIMFWTYDQWGDFINFTNDTIFYSEATTRTVSPAVSGTAGIVLRFQRSLGIVIEGKYIYSRGTLSSDFEGFEKLDLGGFTVSAGVNIYF